MTHIIRDFEVPDTLQVSGDATLKEFAPYYAVIFAMAKVTFFGLSLLLREQAVLVSLDNQ
jgi:hypothetical protein